MFSLIPTENNFAFENCISALLSSLGAENKRLLEGREVCLSQSVSSL